jgi:hypothetical protein
MPEHQSAPYRFEIRVKGTKVHSGASVIGIRFPTSITFQVEPGGGVGTPGELEIELFGENLHRAIRLQKLGSAIVEVSPSWWIQHCKTCREDLIDLALQQFATVAGGAN